MPPALGLYIHWPYCARICPYCDFNVYRWRGEGDEALLIAMLEDLSAQYRLWGQGRRLRSIFFGGGTPSLLSAENIGRVIDAALRLAGLEPDAEISLEANPEDRERFADFAAAGVTRFSLGVQALNDADLRALGRRHSAAEALAAVAAAGQTGRRVSLDLIYARENQTVSAWRDELRGALALPIEHVSLYQLTIEENTAFARAQARGRLVPPSPPRAAALYEATAEECERAGFAAYEISNYARSPAAQAQHNLLYWRNQDWIGLGPSAHGRLTLGQTRWATKAPARPADYIAATAPRLHRESLSVREALEERVLMGLRLAEGLPHDAAWPLNRSVLADLAAAGLLALGADAVTLTPAGRLVADRVALELLS